MRLTQRDDRMTVEALQYANARLKNDLAGWAWNVGKTDNKPNMMLSKQWWQQERVAVGYFGFTDAELEIADREARGYIGTRNGFNCYLTAQSIRNRDERDEFQWR